MGLWESYHGQDAVRLQFQRALSRERLAHAFLFSGPAGVGKRTFARKLAQALLCEAVPDQELDACRSCPNCKRFAAGSHPDYYEISCPEGKKSIPIELFAGDEDHRGRQGLCYELSLKPMSSERKIAIIDDAHLAQREAANSLLKTLEEPSASSLIILVTDREDAILPTIRSRAQLVRFSPLSDRELEAVVSELNLVQSETELADLISISEGSLELAMEMREEGAVTLRQMLNSAYSRLPDSSLKLRSDLYDWINGSGDTSQQRRAALRVVRYFGKLCREGLRDSAGHQEEVDVWMLQIARLREAEQQLQEMMPLTLWCEGLVDDLARNQRGVRT